MRAPRAATRTLRITVTLAGVAAIAWIFSYYVGVALIRYPDFDGALNLNVARSLLEGNGYRSFYHEWVPFFPETNAPYVLPAAAALAVLGITPIGMQIVNLLYLAAFALLTYAIVANLANRLIGVVTVAVVLQTPGLYWFGMNGYGEIPALAYMLAACVALRASIERDDRRLTFLGAILLALSYLTKTVALIWFLPVIAAFAVGTRRRLHHLVVLAVGVALPVLLWELYRVVTLHGIDAYKQWWDTKLDEILDRAGPSSRLQDTAGWRNKLGAHLTLLAGWLGLNASIAVAYLIVFVLSAVFALVQWANDAAGRFVFAALFATALLYLLWWIFVTPTQEAWLRRIVDGLIAIEIVAIVSAYRLARMRRPLSVATAIALGAALTAVVAHNQLVWNRPDDRFDASEARALFDRVTALPHDARLYAAGWYQSPVVALVTGRRFHDLERATESDFNAIARERFLVVEQVALYQHGWLESELARCTCEAIFANGAGRIYSIKGLRPDAAVDSYAVISPKSDVFGPGFFSADGDVRWSTDHSQMRVPFRDFRQLVLSLHVPEPQFMTSGPAPSEIEVMQGQCKLAHERLRSGENQLLVTNGCASDLRTDTLTFRLNGHIRPGAAAPDQRELAWLFRSMELMR